MTAFSANPEQTSVFILAAGRGKRMRPLSDSTPKPLLRAGGKSLIEYHLEGLAKQGFRHVVINVAHLGQLIIDTIGNGESYGLDIHFSFERAGALETLGGIRHAVNKIRSEHFLLINADVWSNADYSSLLQQQPKFAHLLMAENPPHHPDGDFILLNNGVLGLDAENSSELRRTYTGIGLYNKSFIASPDEQHAPLGPLLRIEVLKSRLTGELHEGDWFDIGTPNRLHELDRWLSLKDNEH